MRDLHCHILPGVDDGARDMGESLRMVEAARSAGVTGIVCTPHARMPWFDFEAMRDAYLLLRSQVGDITLQMGFEVHHDLLRVIGPDWIDRLAFDGSGEFLYELSGSFSHATFAEHERIIFEIQRHGYTVIVAHPERYAAIQQDPDLAWELADRGCLFQASASFLKRSRASREQRLARKLFKNGLYSYVASDAHRPEDYVHLPHAVALIE